MISKLFAILVLAGVAAMAASPEAEIRQVLDRQAANWNRGDVESFLKGYGPDATFVGSDVTRGLGPIRERYKKHYPNAAAMGHLTFSEVEVHMLGPDHAYVIGKFHLDRSKEAGGDAGGIYTLIFEHFKDGWKIVVDHTA